MKLEYVKEINSETIKALEGAKILAGAKYNLENETYDASANCERCDCVCNQPCHGEGPCYSL